MMKRSTFWKRSGVALVAASALVLTACSGGGTDAGSGESTGGGNADVGNGILHIGTTTEVVNWAPLDTVSITDTWVMGQMYPSLSTQMSDGTFVPHVADSVDVSDDGTQVVIKLNPDFKWSDGEPITSKDIEFTLDRLRDDALLNGAGYISNYESTEMPDDTTALINMKNPSFGWVVNIRQSMMVLPEHVFADVPTLKGFSIENEPDRWVSGGSFTLSKVVAGQRYDMVPNEHYPLRTEGNDAVTGLEFLIYGDVNTMQLALRNNDIDVMAPIVPSSAIAELEKQENIVVQAADSAFNYTKLTFNAANEPLSDAKVRNAVAGLVDTEAIITNVLQGYGQPGTSPILPALTEYQPDVKPFASTPEDAKKVLADAGFADPTFVLVCDQGNSSHAKSAQLVRDMLSKADITVDVRCAERATSLTAAKAGQFDLYIHKLGQGNAPSTSLFLQFDPSNPSGLNYNFTDDQTSAKLIAAAQDATTQEEYVKTVKAAAAHIHEQAYMVPLYAESIVSAFNDTRFTGYLSAPQEQITMISPYSLAQVVPSGN